MSTHCFLYLQFAKFLHFWKITLFKLKERCPYILNKMFFSENEFFYRWLANHQLDVGLLSENDYTIQRRKDVCKEMLWLEEQGYYVAYLDES